MKCLDNIYTKQIKYNSPVLYQLESLKKEYEKLLKVSNEIIKTGSFIEECYFENQSAVLSDNEITFSGNLKFKTDAGNYFQNITSSLKLNVQGTGEIVVDVGEDNKTLVFKLDEEFLSEISLMIENLETLTEDFASLKEKFESQIFDNFIGIRNTTDSKIDQIKHINNNFQITSNDGKSLLNIDEVLEKIYSFNKRLLTEDDSKNVEKVELIYDKESSDININKGLTSGITDGSSINENLAVNYKRLYLEIYGWGAIYGRNGYSIGFFDIDKLYNPDYSWSLGAFGNFFTFYEGGFMFSYGGMVTCENNKTTFQIKRYAHAGSETIASGLPIFRIWGVKR